MTTDHRIAYGTLATEARTGETVLDALLRVGAPLTFSCKSGVCHACLLRCSSGHVPARAQRGLPPHLADRQYLLACQCVPDTSMVLGPRRPEDQLTACVLIAVEGHGSRTLTVTLEPARALAWRAGDRVRLVVGDAGPEPELVLTGAPDDGPALTALLPLPPGTPEPAALRIDHEFGAELVLRGPFPAAAPAATAQPPAGPEIGAPTPDPALWQALGDGRTARTVLEAFYAAVYQDPQLAPFFEGVTMARAIEKQYSFMKACITGERCYFGNRPRNAHHWMVISDAVFDHRQALMARTLRAAGLGDDLVARWTSFEEHFRADMVKAAAWPRQVGDTWVDTEGFDTEVLGEASVCDYCGDEVAAGTTVRFHRRLGRIGCLRCQTAGTATPVAHADDPAADPGVDRAADHAAVRQPTHAAAAS